MLENAVRVPRGALQPGGYLYRLDADDRLEQVHVDIVRTDAEWAVAVDGLRPGDRVCLTPLLFFVEGMRVQPVGASGEQGDPQPGQVK